MKFFDLLRMSISNLWKRKLRTVLTVLGVVIGITSIVVMVALGNGLKQSMLDNYANYSSMTQIQIYSGGYYYSSSGSGQDEQKKLDDAFVQELLGMEHVKEVYPRLNISAMAKVGKYAGHLDIYGITKEEFAAREEEALRCTLKVDDLYQMDEVYLTEMEMLCIRQRIQVLPVIEKRKCIDFLLRYFEGYESKNELSDCIAIYEFAALCVICELGNLREHKQSITLAKRALREELGCRRIWGLDEYLYEILWNGNEKMTGNISQCIILSHFCKRIFYEDFYYSKLHQS